MYSPSYALDLPDSKDVQGLFDELQSYWQFRDDLAYRARTMLKGRNEILLPKAKGYVPVARHTFKLKSIMNQKLARFGALPEAAVMPMNHTEKATKSAQDVENWLRAALYEMNRRAKGFWLPAVEDAALLDEGLIRVDRAPAAFWPDLVPVGEDDFEYDEDGELIEDDDGNPVLSENVSKERREFIRLFESDPDEYAKLADSYKKKAGLPIRAEYVPREAVLDYKESGQQIYGFEIDYQPLRAVLGNPMYDVGELNEQLEWSEGKGEAYDMMRMVPILRYFNQNWTAYYVLKAWNDKSHLWLPDTESISTSSPLQADCLYKHEHGLGMTPYASIPGRFGGWRAEHNGIEEITEALCELNQYLDEMQSQAMTNIRASYWPTKIVKLSREAGRQETKGRPRPINVNEGGDITIWQDESVETLFEAQKDPMFEFIWSEIEQAMSDMGGAPVLFGSQVPGVETGYHEAQKISQAESLDNMFADGLAQGFVNLCTLILQHVKVMDEKVYVNYVTRREGDGKRYMKSHGLDPADLEPMPHLDAQVTKPRPMDLISMARLAIDLTSPYADRGPLVSQEFARKTLLQIDDDSLEESKIRIEEMERKAYMSGVIQQSVLEKLRLQIVQNNAPDFDPSAPENADPAALAAAQSIMQNEAAAPTSGGVDPRIINGVDLATNRTPGPPPGAAQPEQVIGAQVASRERTRA